LKKLLDSFLNVPRVCAAEAAGTVFSLVLEGFRRALIKRLRPTAIVASVVGQEANMEAKNDDGIEGG
jgi:hypothetical protein